MFRALLLEKDETGADVADASNDATVTPPS